MSRCSIFALYLPQFHQIPENDKWWGKGFTEWTSLRNAKRISRYSFQPRVPLNGYYDLSDYHAIEAQAKLAKKYGLDGFAIYNYYSNGKILLGKPVELLLAHKEIDIKYFFSWANHDWRRTWYGYDMEVLQKQEYGNEMQIAEHYNYLSRFFKDPRYLKIDNKPVFAIYKSTYVQNLGLYEQIWDKMAKRDGFSGLYYVKTIDSSKLNTTDAFFDACFDFEPGYSLSQKSKLELVINKLRTFLRKELRLPIVSQVYDYDRLCSKIESRKHSSPRYYYGVFTDWDNTPRHKYMGLVVKNASPERFQKQFDIQYKKAIDNNSELLIVNAWNEWTEGAYLEPDTRNKYALLEAIKTVVDKYSNGD